MIPTDEQAKQLYRIVDTKADEVFPMDDEEWPTIIQEMRDVVAAKSDRAAGKVIEFWGCWDARRTATGDAKKIRKAWEAMKGTP